MKVTRNITNVIVLAVNTARQVAEGVEMGLLKLSCKQRQEADLKIFKLTVKQIHDIEKKLLKGAHVQLHTVTSPAQQRAMGKIWTKFAVIDQKARASYMKVSEHLMQLQLDVLADLELCSHESEQRAIVARFKKHDLSQPWAITECPRKYVPNKRTPSGIKGVK
jgi:hypothetical protein